MVKPEITALETAGTCRERARRVILALFLRAEMPTGQVGKLEICRDAWHAHECIARAEGQRHGAPQAIAAVIFFQVTL